MYSVRLSRIVVCWIMAVLLLSGYAAQSQCFDYSLTPALFSNYPTLKEPNSLAAGDFNGDNVSDLVVVHYRPDTPYSIRVYFGNVSGRFSAPDSYSLSGNNPVRVAVGDLSGDGKPDIAVLTLNEGIYILINNGSGTFGSPAKYTNTVLIGADDLKIGDINNDTKPDIVTSTAYVNNYVTVWPNNGSGILGTPTVYTLVNATESLALGDVSGDNVPDIVTASQSTSNVSVMVNNGSGGFGAVTSYSAGVSARSVTVAHLNGDARGDIIVAGTSSNGVSVLLNNGSGGFGTASQYVSGYSPYSVVAQDIDSDSDLDLVVVNEYSSNVAVLLNNGSGTFGTRTVYGVAEGPRAVTVGDFNGDGKPDLATANYENNSISLLLHDAANGFGCASVFEVGSDASLIVKADFDGDSRMDVATANDSDKIVTILLNNGVGGSLGTPSSYSVTGGLFGITAIATGDFNKDGKPDLVTANYSSTGEIYVLTNSGSGAFGPPVKYSGFSRPGSIVVADFDADTYPDIAVSNDDFTGNISVLLNNRSGGFGPIVNFAGQPGEKQLVAGDVNGDSYPDLIAGYQFGNLVEIYPGNGAGGFGTSTTYAAGVRPENPVTGDFNHDGKIDVAVSTTIGLAVLLNNGSGGLLPAVFYPFGEQVFSMDAGDINGDQFPDLVMVSILANTRRLSWLINKGDGTFGPAFSTNTLGSVYSLVVHDFNNDAKNDIAAIWPSSASVQIVYNTISPISSQLASGSAVCAGSTVTASVSVTGTVTGYQWFYNGTALSGQTTATLSLTNVQPAQSGNYVVVLTNSCLSQTSTSFSLAVNNSTIYVTESGTGTQSGSDWANAMPGTSLQLAIDRAATCGGGGQVWVAAGLYKPTTSSGPASQTISFSMRNNVAIYGGFLGSETALTGRPAVNPVTGNPSSSTLSGDIGTVGNDQDNSYHVIYNYQSLALNHSALLDGFVITAGNGINSVYACPNYYGGGMYNDGSSPSVVNCLFSGNSSPSGGGMFNRLTYATAPYGPSVSNTVFAGNTAQKGGGMFNLGSIVSLKNVIFRDNYASNGGAIYNRGALASGYVNTVFQSNSAVSGGGIFNETASTLQLTNVTFRDNQASAVGGALYNATTNINNTATLINSIVYNNGGGNTFYNAPPNGTTLVSSVSLTYSLYEPGSATATGVITSGPGNRTTVISPFLNATSVALGSCSPAIDGGVNAATGLTSITTDLTGNDRLYQNGTVDMGATEFEGVGLPVSYSVLGSGTATCASSPTITLSGSEVGVSYQLQQDGVNSGTVVDGTGNALSFGPQSVSGIYTVLATGVGGCTATMAGSATVVSSTAVLSVMEPSVNTAVAGVTFSQSFSVSGGGVPPSFSLAQGALPVGLTLSEAGQITGIPTQSGVFAITALATVATGCSALSTYTLTVNCPSLTVNTPTVATATAGINTQGAFIWYLTGSSTYSFTFGGLPPGLSVITSNPNYRVIGGTATQAGVFPVSLTLTDQYGCTFIEPPFNLTVNCPSLTVNTPTVATATAGINTQGAFIWYLTGAGTYSFTFGGLPPGLSVITSNPNYRVIGGTATQAGVFPVSLTLVNQYGCTFIEPPFNLTVNCPSLTVNTPTVSTATAGINTQGAFIWYLTGSSTYSFTFGGLPPGLSVITSNPNYRVIGGTATQTGVFPVSLTLVNQYGCTFIEPPFNLTVNCPSMGISTTANPATCGPTGTISFTTTLPSGTYSLSYSGVGSPQQVVVSNGSFGLFNLPAGTYSSFSLVQPNTGCLLQVNSSVTLTNPEAPVPVLTAGNGGMLSCANTSLTLTASGGSSYTFARSGGGGIITQNINAGTAVVNMSGTYSVTVASSAGCTSQTTITIGTDNTLPTVSIAPTSGTLTCSVTTLTLTATSSVSAIRWSTGATTASITINAANTYSITATGGNGCTATTDVTIGSNTAPPSLSITPSSVTLTCGSPSAILSVVGTGDVRWSTGAVSNTVSVATAGTYSVTLTGSNGCISVSSATVVSGTVTPSLSINPSAAYISCASPVVSLSAIGSGTVRWSTNETTPVISVSVVGPYSVTLVDGACSAVVGTVVSFSQLGAVTITSGGNLGCGVTTTTIRVASSGAASFTLLGPAGYTQTNSTGIFSVSAGGSYTGLAGQAGCVESNTVVVTEGGVQPTISTVQALGMLGAGSCSVAVQATGYGDRYVLTGPGGYVFSVVFRTAGNHSVSFPMVVKPGMYTLTVYSGNCVVSRTVTVSGTACP